MNVIKAYSQALGTHFASDCQHTHECRRICPCLTPAGGVTQRLSSYHQESCQKLGVLAPTPVPVTPEAVRRSAAALQSCGCSRCAGRGVSSMSGNGGPPPYTLCDPFDEQSFLPRNIAVSLCCLAVNISFLVYYYRLHQMPESFHGLHSLEEESTSDLDEEEGAALRPRRKKQGVFSLNWGFGGKWYLYRESLNGFFITFPTILWFFVFHLTGNREYACAWQYGLYGRCLLDSYPARLPSSQLLLLLQVFPCCFCSLLWFPSLCTGWVLQVVPSTTRHLT